MSRTLHVVTPENIEVGYELAGMGSRFLAVLVDHTLQVALILAVLIAGSLGGWTGSLLAGSASLLLIAVATFVAFAIFFGYFAFFEIAWAGRTPGKRAVGLRVSRDGGYPVDPYYAIIRNLVRIIDFLPGAYG